MKLWKPPIIALVVIVLAIVVASRFFLPDRSKAIINGNPARNDASTPARDMGNPLDIPIENQSVKRSSGPNLENARTILVKIFPVQAVEYEQIKDLGSPDGKNWNESHTMSLDADKRGFYGLYLASGQLIKIFPASVNVSPSREPEKQEYNAKNISWEWLDSKRIIGVQEIDYRGAPDPYADVKSDIEITISAPGGAKIYLFDVDELDKVSLLDIPKPEKGLSVHLDGIGKEGIIALSARSPLGYHQGSQSMAEDPKHYRSLGFFRVEKIK